MLEKLTLSQLESLHRETADIPRGNMERGAYDGVVVGEEIENIQKTKGNP
jgi:hypothetical protein